MRSLTKMTTIMMATTVMMIALLFIVNSVTATKRGYCPSVALDQMGICQEECSMDEDCSGTQKCCKNGCGHTCQKARTSKPGDCPAIDPDNIMCIKYATSPCTTDIDCDNVEKCCWTGCSPYCTKPAPREGLCPVVASDVMGACVQECTEDHECDSPKKCCSNGCGMSCQNPEVPKPGICPAVEEGMMGLCMEACSRDSECEGEQKCCSNGCGHACAAPANHSCFVEGKYYLPGTAVPDPDRCNNCFCAGGHVGCTLMLCSCERNGNSYYMGQTYPAGDGCNNCTCRGERGHDKDKCTDYVCDTEPPKAPFQYMNTVAVVTACLGGIGLIITVIALTATYCICKSNKKRKQKVMSLDEKSLVGGELPSKA